MSGAPQPLVTVLVTTYNHARFIEQALESIVAQRTTFPYEVVVIEDCSTDGTRELVKSFAAAHPEKVRLALAPRNENSNRLFAEEWASSASEYVATLDGDDYWTSPEKLQLQVDAMEARPEYALCFHDVTVVAEGMAYVWRGRFSEGFGDGVRIRRLAHLAPVVDREQASSSVRRRTIDPDELWSGCFVPGCSPLLRRSFLPQLPEEFTPLEFGDWALYLLAGAHGAMLYLDVVLGAYRVHPAGMWSGLPSDVQHAHVVSFMEQMLTLAPDREGVIRTQIARHRAAGNRQRRRAYRYGYVAAALAGAPPGTATEDALATHAPADARVIWVDPVRPSGLRGRLLPFPPTPSVREEPFAPVASGSRSVDWIAPGFAYEFHLHDDGSEAEIAAVTVVADQPAAGPAGPVGPRSDDEAPLDRAYVRATPNPAVAEDTHAQTTVEWSTDASSAHVTVSAYSLDEGMPEDDDGAIELLEELRRGGGDFMLITPPCLSLLELYPGLAAHLADKYRLVVDDAAVGRLYDLRA